MVVKANFLVINMSAKTNTLLRFSEETINDCSSENLKRLLDYVNDNYNEKDVVFSIPMDQFFDTFSSDMFYSDDLNPSELNQAPDVTVVCMVVTHLIKRGVEFDEAQPSYVRFFEKFGSELQRLDETIAIVDDIMKEL